MDSWTEKQTWPSYMYLLYIRGRVFNNEAGAISNGVFLFTSPESSVKTGFGAGGVERDAQTVRRA